MIDITSVQACFSLIKVRNLCHTISLSADIITYCQTSQWKAPWLQYLTLPLHSCTSTTTFGMNQQFNGSILCSDKRIVSLEHHSTPVDVVIKVLKRARAFSDISVPIIYQHTPVLLYDLISTCTYMPCMSRCHSVTEMLVRRQRSVHICRSSATRSQSDLVCIGHTNKQNVNTICTVQLLH